MILCRRLTDSRAFTEEGECLKNEVQDYLYERIRNRKSYRMCECERGKDNVGKDKWFPPGNVTNGLEGGRRASTPGKEVNARPEQTEKKTLKE